MLIRALEPIDGLDEMWTARRIDLTKMKTKNAAKLLTAGPSKLCQAMSITKILFDQTDLTNNEQLWVQDDGFKPAAIMSSKRIGIENTGEEAVNKLYRFYIKNNPFISVKESKNDVPHVA